MGDNVKLQARGLIARQAEYNMLNNVTTLGTY